ncbi:unnamed protein product [Durusdinium trenchii]|uniref:Uncharacterized protein n=1 Tax=Durusdinium trenchii TaxID=1381693 RepID=A0ABP0N8S9_9DINO
MLGGNYEDSDSEDGGKIANSSEEEGNKEPEPVAAQQEEEEEDEDADEDEDKLTSASKAFKALDALGEEALAFKKFADNRAKTDRVRLHTMSLDRVTSASAATLRGQGWHPGSEAKDAVIPEEVAVKRPRDDEEESKGKGQRKLMAIEELEQLSEGAPTQYIVAQGVCFLKPGEDPTSQKILKAKRPVGSKIYTTGTIWKGPQGGVWAEVDIGKSPGEMGWALVEGPGFGLRGPSLIDPEANDGASQMIHIRWLKDPPIFNCLMPKTATVGDLVDTFCARTGLNRKETILTKGLPNKAPNGSGALLPVDYTDPKDVLFRELRPQCGPRVGSCSLEGLRSKALPRLSCSRLN